MAKNSECIYERNDSFQVKIPYYDESGKRTSYSKSFKIKKYGSKAKALEMARKHRDEIRVKLADNQIIKEQHYTLNEVFEKMLENDSGVLSTKKKMRSTYNAHIKDFIGGGTDFASIKFDDIKKNLLHIASESKDDIVQRAKIVWNKMYKYAIPKGIVIRNETDFVDTPKSDIITIKKDMTCSYEDVLNTIALVEKRVKNRRDSIMIQADLYIQWYTGMRPAEVLALSKKNVDIENRTIYICQSVGSSTTEFNVIKRTKNEYSIRTFKGFSKMLVPIFETLFEMAEDDLLFVRDNGELMDGNYLSDMCSKAANFRPYTIRHQFSTDMLDQGVNLRAIGEMMGHKGIDMAIEYARSNDRAKNEALKLTNRA